MRLVQKALTFDDVLLVPAYSAVLPRDVQLSTHLSRNISLNIPLVSAAMDTVTDARLAIALAQEGGIGIIHKNMTPKEQAAEVMKVKRHEAGVLRDPITITQDMTVRDAIELQRAHKILRSAGGRGQARSRHRDQSRSALRDAARCADPRHHDSALTPGDRARRRDSRGSTGAAA